MPRGDGTGPRGFGSRTGRGAGFCSGYPVPGFANPFPGRGYAPGRAYGRGYGTWGFPEYPGYFAGPSGGKGFLTEQAEFLREQLSLIEARLRELEDAGE